MDKIIFFYLIHFSLDEIPKINICHMVVKEHPDIIEGRQRLIAVDVLDSEEVSEDASIDRVGSASDEEYGSGLVGAVCYRRGGRYVEGFEIFSHFVLYG